MELRAWCGHCGESFRLAELVDGGFSGRCPRCSEEFAPGYVPVAAAAVGDLLAAAAGLEQAAARLGESAPRLHVDTRKLAGDIAAALGGS
jgi:hypothetical protein